MTIFKSKFKSQLTSMCYRMISNKITCEFNSVKTKEKPSRHWIHAVSTTQETKQNGFI